jgi:GGDEF domain-containing protein
MKLFGKKRDEDTHDYELNEVLEIAAQGRRLAIYDRATKLYAYWYLQLRGDEEIARAKRYKKTVCVLSIWAETPPLIDALSRELRDGLREHDLAAYLNNGHFVVLLSETDARGALIVIDRIAKKIGAGISASVAAYPDDGQNFDELLESAKSRAEHKTGAA